MASGTIVTGDNHVIKPGLRADIMRNLMETKNTLSHAGSIYVGSGAYTAMGPSGDTIDVYKTKELQPGTAYQVLSTNADGDDLEYRYVSALSFGGDAAVKSFLGTYTALLKTEEVAGHADSVLIKVKSGDSSKKVYVEHAYTAETADEALTANVANTATTATSASLAAQVQLDTNGTITNVKLYTKTYSTFNEFQNHDYIKSAASTGAILQAMLARKSGGNIVEYIPVIVIPGIISDQASKNNARIFDASSETAQWRTLTSDDFTGGNILKVTYVR